MVRPFATLSRSSAHRPAPTATVASLLGALLLALAGCQRDDGAAPTPVRSTTVGGAGALPAMPAMPAEADGQFPALLSQTGAFTDLSTLAASSTLMPFTVNCALWSDGALKQRWLALPPGGRIHFTPTGEWSFPGGTVFVKHFALASDERVPSERRFLETRFLVRAARGGIYGVTYRWRADRSDAELLPDGRDEEVRVRTADGGERVQKWHYPSRSECLLCHNPVAGFVLGVKTQQLNRVGEGAGAAVNQLTAMAGRGMFDQAPSPETITALPHLVALDDAHALHAERARSYLDANCAHCHRPGMVGFATFDARYDTPLDEQNLIRARVIIDHGIDGARNIMPHDPWRSMVLVRMETAEELRMPPLARNLVDHAAVQVVREWIGQLPGKAALPPPRLTPASGRYPEPITVRAQEDDPEAVLHYTTDGSLPDDQAPVFPGMLRIDSPTVLRIKALRKGFASSVVVNGLYQLEPVRR